MFLYIGYIKGVTVWRPQIGVETEVPITSEALELLQRLLPEPDSLILTHHLRQRSHERQVDIFDIRKALETGCVTADSWDENHQNWKYRVCGRDTEGDSLTVIVVLHETAGIIKVITAYD